MATRAAARVQRLRSSDAAAVRRLLDAEPVVHAYLRSELRLGVDRADWWGVRDGDRLRAVLLAGPLSVPCIPDAADAALLAETACAASPPRMLVGPRAAVAALRDALLPVQQPREVREPQPLLALDSTERLPLEAVPVRPATRADVEALAVAAAAMHREEMGGEPVPVDPSAWRARMVSLVDLGWSWAWTERDHVVFKAELSAWTPEAVQIQGVYTHPSRRGRGVASAGLAAVCRTLLRSVPVCSLYVNADNDTALRLYDRLGFRRTGDFATVFY